MAAAEHLQERLTSLPLTLAHHDAQWTNSFAATESGTGTVLIDWSYLGLAPVGTDLGLSVVFNVLNGAVDRRRAHDHDRSATAAYLRGLREYGWDGSADGVRFVRAASASLAAVTLLAAQASWLCPTGASSEWDLSSWPQDEAAKRHVEVSALLADWAAGLDFALDLGEEALQLADRLHLDGTSTAVPR